MQTQSLYQKKSNKNTLGILTGLTYQSGLEYYKNINEKYMEIKGVNHIIAPNPNILAYSVDIDIYHNYLKNKQFKEANQYIVDNIEILQNTDVVAIACNTAHMAYKDIIQQYPNIKMLHIADALAYRLKQDQITTVGLLGTYPTMTQDFIKGRLLEHGIQTIVPQQEEDLQKIYELIVQDLNYRIFADETYKYFSEQILNLKDRGAQAIILGCTEIEYLLTSETLHDLNLYPTANIHYNAIVEILTNQKSLNEYLPVNQNK